MRLTFVGSSHAARHLSAAAAQKGFTLCELTEGPDLVFVSEDTPTAGDGSRDQRPIQALCMMARRAFDGPIVLTSQVEPGFTRSLDIGLYHQAETLRIRDAAARAARPEMMIVGLPNFSAPVHREYSNYLITFGCPILWMTLEEAEFAKIAINMTLASQVDCANRLAAAASKVGASWKTVSGALMHDKRIGEYAYLNPGRWEDSPHLLRDHVTLRQIEER